MLFNKLPINPNTDKLIITCGIIGGIWGAKYSKSHEKSLINVENIIIGTIFGAIYGLLWPVTVPGTIIGTGVYLYDNVNNIQVDSSVIKTEQNTQVIKNTERSHYYNEDYAEFE